MRREWAVQLGLCLGFLTVACAEPNSHTPPHVLLISIDTLRADHLHVYGYVRETSPTIDRLAQEGARFDAAISPSSWTLPVHMSLLTGLYPSFHKIDRSGRAGTRRLDASIPTLAERLSEAGFATAGLAANAYLDPAWGFDRGFDSYATYVTQATEQTDRALAWLNERRLGNPGSRPFFLFLHYMDPHGLGKPTTFVDGTTPKDGIRHRINLYDGQVHLVDREIGRIVAALKNAGVLDQTLIVVTSDHGEEFREHGGISHKSTLYEEQVHVPLIMRYPPRIQAQVQSEPVSLVDVPLTILDALGIGYGSTPGAESLWPRLRGEAPAAKRGVFAELHPVGLDAGWDYYLRSIRGSRYKLIRRGEANGRVQSELYDLSEDPGEQHSRIDDPRLQGVRDELEPLLLEFIELGEAYRPDAARQEFDLDPEHRERLRALGYAE